MQNQDMLETFLFLIYNLIQLYFLNSVCFTLFCCFYLRFAHYLRYLSYVICDKVPCISKVMFFFLTKLKSMAKIN